MQAVGAQRRIPSLDGLRALSILLVIGGHFSDRPAGNFLASLGVHIFFVISGYLITRLLLEEHADTQKISLAGFYRRRCFRIFPAAFTYIAIIGILSPNSRAGLWYAMTYTASYRVSELPTNFLHLWSLSVEEQFYLLWPLALVLGFRRRIQMAWAAFAAAAAFRLAVVLNHLPGIWLHFSFPGTMDSVAAGCLLALYWPQIKERAAWMAEVNAVLIAIPLAVWVLNVALWSGPAACLWGVVHVLIALWTFLLIERQPMLLNNGVASTIGLLSYSLYLWQEPFTLERTLPSTAALPLLAACAVMSYLIVEKPMIQFGRRFGSGAHAKRVSAAIKQ